LAQGGSFVLNLANEEEIINVKCKVSLQLIDAQSTEIIESADGEVEKQISVKDMRISLGGIQIKEGAPPMKVVTEYNVSVVERAFFNALVALSPKLDTILADPNFVESKPIAARKTDVAGIKDGPRSDQSPNQPGKKRKGLNIKNSPATLAETPAAPATPTPSTPDTPAPSAPSTPATPTPPTPGPNEVSRGAFCSKCGAKMAPEAKFCAGCGAKITP